MPLSRLPKHLPAGTKYVLEARGPWVRRFVEWPDGHRLELDPRKSLRCRCLAQRELDAARSKAEQAAA
jgi:hypothetical protein